MVLILHVWCKHLPKKKLVNIPILTSCYGGHSGMNILIHPLHGLGNNHSNGNQLGHRFSDVDSRAWGSFGLKYVPKDSYS